VRIAGCDRKAAHGSSGVCHLFVIPAKAGIQLLSFLPFATLPIFAPSLLRVNLSLISGEGREAHKECE
jgi:hypothetical protein